MVAGMLLQTVLRGTSSHIGHAIHVAKLFVKAAEGSDNFPIKDEAKLHVVADGLGIDTNGKQTLDIAKEVGRKAMEDLVGPGEGPMSFALALAPKNIDKLAKANLIPHKGATETIVQGIHSTAQGMMSSTDQPAYVLSEIWSDRRSGSLHCHPTTGYLARRPYTKGK
jgi:carbon-monoxide dehydrogenase catalytic subunit